MNFVLYIMRLYQCNIIILVMTSKETFVVNSEEDLQGYFHSVHSFIRNRFGLYGKAALQFFNFFFVLKVIEPFIENKQLDFNNGFDEDDEDYVEESLKIQRTQLIKKKIFESEHKETFFTCKHNIIKICLYNINKFLLYYVHCSRHSDAE